LKKEKRSWKIKLTSIFFALILFFATPVIFSQDLNLDNFDPAQSYLELLDDYSSLLDEHETLIDDYEILLNDFEELNNKYAEEVNNHEKSKQQILDDQAEIEELRKNLINALALADYKYFTIIPKVGYGNGQFSFGVGFNARLPKLPISIFANIDYINAPIPINAQIGIGIRF